MRSSSHMLCSLATAAVLLLAPVSPAGAAGAAVDLTDRIRAETGLDEEIAAACARHCQGNKRQGLLRSATARRLDGDRVAVTGEAVLRNRQVQEPPALLGGILTGPVTLFDYAVTVRAEAEVELASCALEVRRVRVANDHFGLADMIRQRLAGPHRVRDCRQLLRGV